MSFLGYRSNIFCRFKRFMAQTTCFIKNINNIRALHYIITSTLDTWRTKAMVVSTVGSRLDHCDSILHGMSQAHIDRPQRVQNVLARVVTEAPWTISCTTIRRDLHWLPVNHRITYKLCLIAWKTLYRSELIAHYLPSRSLRSSNTILLARPYVITSSFLSQGILRFCTIYLELSAWTHSPYRQIFNFQTPIKIVPAFRLVTLCQIGLLLLTPFPLVYMFHLLLFVHLLLCLYFACSLTVMVCDMSNFLLTNMNKWMNASDSFYEFSRFINMCMYLWM